MCSDYVGRILFIVCANQLPILANEAQGVSRIKQSLFVLELEFFQDISLFSNYWAQDQSFLTISFRINFLTQNLGINCYRDFLLC